MTDQDKRQHLQHNSTLAVLNLHGASLQLADSCYQLNEMFKSNPALPGVLIFDGNSFHSMVSRQLFLEIMHQPYSKELFGRKKIRKLAKQFNMGPLSFSSETFIGKAVEDSLQRPDHLVTEPLVVINNDVYLILDLYELLRAHAHIFSATVKTLNTEIMHSTLLREKLEQANKEAEEMARLDGLTGIPNRRCMDEYLTNEWQRALREKTEISVVLLDIDFFKVFNDTYGHQSGDDALARVARCLKKQIHRPADMVARYGGEEFLIILPDTPVQGAFSLAEKMCQHIHELEIPNSSSNISPYLTISCGVSSIIPEESIPLDRVIHFADKALYQAKHKGRNRVTIMQHPPL